MRGSRLSRWFRLVRKVGTVLAVLLLPPLLMGAGMPSGHAPLPTAAGVHGAVVRLVDFVTGKQPQKTPVPAQQEWPTPGNQRQAPATAGRDVARAGRGQRARHMSHSPTSRSSVNAEGSQWHVRIRSVMAARGFRPATRYRTRPSLQAVGQREVPRTVRAERRDLRETKTARPPGAP